MPRTFLLGKIRGQEEGKEWIFDCDSTLRGRQTEEAERPEKTEEGNHGSHG
jgi:hypothetical protein